MTMDRQDKPKSPDEIEQEIAHAARVHPDDDLRSTHDDLMRRLEATRRPTTLDDLDHRLYNIDDHLAHIKHNTEMLERTEVHLSDIAKSTKATMESARAANGNLFAIALMAAFWSVFFLWKYIDDIHALFRDATNHIFHS